MILNYELPHDEAQPPAQAHQGDAGLDWSSIEDVLH